MVSWGVLCFIISREDGENIDELMDMLLAKKSAADRRAWLETKGNLAEVVA
jgi:topoisomerase IV subunit B